MMLARVVRRSYAQATASMLRRVLLGVLLLWAIGDSLLTYRDAVQRSAPYWLVSLLAAMSLFASLVFVGLFFLAWDWLAKRSQASIRK